VSAQELITEHLDLWTGAVTKKSTSGRGSNGKVELTGVKKLRELILELAVRGKLVEQTPTDEPATRLLSKTKALREQLIREGKLRRQKKTFSAEDIDKPFEIPASWSWATLPDVASYSPGKTPSTKAPKFWAAGASGIPWVSIADLNHNGTIRDTTKAVTQTAADEVFRSEPVAPGTILMSFKLTVGKMSITEVPAYHNEAIISILPFNGVSRDYLFKVMPMLALGGNAKRAIMGNTLNATSMAQILVPLPPKEEQHRIVQKVDELMALCDRLEQQTSDQLEAHETLTDTLLGTLTQSDNATELADNWARLAAHFDTLFTTEQSIDKLKQTILQLAVMGRLVERMESDTPVSKTLEMAANEKNKLAREGKVKKPKQQMPITAMDKPFRIPSHWRWTRFGQLVTDFANGLYKPAKFYSSRGTISLRMFNIQDGSITLEGARRVEIDDKEFSQYRLAPGDILINRVNSKELVGKAAVAPDSEEPMVFESMNMRARLLIDHTESRYINLVLRSGFVKHYLLGLAKEAIGQASLNQTQISSIMIPFPPIEEQHRIVQKVDELMALCDQLKERLNQASETRNQLAESVVEGALSS